MFEAHPFVIGTKLTLRIRSARTRDTRDTRGQAMVEFALVLPVLVLIMLGVMQFGILFWTQITLTQIARDTGRWTVSQGWSCGGTQPVDAAAGTNILAQANAIANRSTLFAWSATNPLTFASGPTYTNGPPGGGTKCPPLTNQEVWNITFELQHDVPIFVPFIATNGCAGGCERALTSEVTFRMEPRP